MLRLPCSWPYHYAIGSHPLKPAPVPWGLSVCGEVHATKKRSFLPTASISLLVIKVSHFGRKSSRPSQAFRPLQLHEGPKPELLSKSIPGFWPTDSVRNNQYLLFFMLQSFEEISSAAIQEFSPWLRKIPWRRKWQPNPIFLSGNSRERGVWWATVHGVTKESDMT